MDDSVDLNKVILPHELPVVIWFLNQVLLSIQESWDQRDNDLINTLKRVADSCDLKEKERIRIKARNYLNNILDPKNIVSYNDAPSTTQRKVVAFLEYAITELESKL